MPPVLHGTVGIMPAGALGVSMFYHLTGGLARLDGSVFFVERSNSSSAASLRQSDHLVVVDSRQAHRMPLARIWAGDLLACDLVGRLPEVLLVCTNPDQLLGVVSVCVEVVEHLHGRGELEAIPLPLPLVVLCSNGIYFQRIRQVFIEKLEESTLLGRLPDLWPELMPKLVGRLLRGVTIQTGIREASGPATVYRPGPQGLTRLAGGEPKNRERCHELLTALGGWFEIVLNQSPTRVEFDKAMVNLVSNLLGQLQAIDREGNFRVLKVADFVTPKLEPEIRELAGAVFRVGQAVKAYGPHEDFETIVQKLYDTFRLHREHVPSSIQWVDLSLRTGSLGTPLSPTERWLLDPLIHYARSAGLDETVQYFEGLKRELEARLACLRHRGTTSAE